MLNLRPYNGGPDVEFSELILQFSHHLYFAFVIITTPPTFFFWTTQQGTPPQGSNLCPLQWKHRVLITREFPRLYFLKNIHYFIHLFILFLTVLSLCCCTSFSLVVASWGCSLVTVCWLLTAGASSVVKHRL